MKITRPQLRQVIDAISVIAQQYVEVNTNESKLYISFNNISHHCKVNGDSFSSTAETIDKLGRYCLNEFFNNKEVVDVHSINVDSKEFYLKDLTHIQALSLLAEEILKKKTSWRMMFTIRKGNSRVELNTFDGIHLYRKYLSPDNKDVIIFKDKAEAMFNLFNEHTIQSVNIFKDNLTEGKFRDYLHDSTVNSGKRIRYVNPK